MTVHVSERTRRLVMARGRHMPPAVEPNLAKWAAADKLRRERLDGAEVQRRRGVVRTSSLELERSHALEANRPWIEKPPPPKVVSRTEQAHRTRRAMLAAMVGESDADAVEAVVRARLQGDARAVPGAELDLRGLDLTMLDEGEVTRVAKKRGVVPWNPEQLRCLFHDADSLAVPEFAESWGFDGTGFDSSQQHDSSRVSSRAGSRSQGSASSNPPGSRGSVVSSTSIDVIGGVDIPGIHRAWGTPYRKLQQPASHAQLFAEL